MVNPILSSTSFILCHPTEDDELPGQNHKAIDRRKHPYTFYPCTQCRSDSCDISLYNFYDAIFV